jgi:hypothetical protein
MVSIEFPKLAAHLLQFRLCCQGPCLQLRSLLLQFVKHLLIVLHLSLKLFNVSRWRPTIGRDIKLGLLSIQELLLQLLDLVFHIILLSKESLLVRHQLLDLFIVSAVVLFSSWLWHLAGIIGLIKLSFEISNLFLQVFIFALQVLHCTLGTHVTSLVLVFLLVFKIFKVVF